MPMWPAVASFDACGQSVGAILDTGQQCAEIIATGMSVRRISRVSSASKGAAIAAAAKRFAATTSLGRIDASVGLVCTSTASACVIGSSR